MVVRRNDMKMTKLGPDKRTVPVFIQGLMRTADMTVEELTNLLNNDLELGISYLDTSDIYADGYCEELLGKSFAQNPGLREKFILQTKGGIRRGTKGFTYYDFSKEYIISACEASMKRLKADHLDYYLLHRPDALVEPQEVAAALDELFQSGKVLHFGVSNCNTSQIELLKKYVKCPLEINQMEFTLGHSLMLDPGMDVNRVETQSYDHDQGVLNYCRLQNITIQAFSPFRAAKNRNTGTLIDRYGVKVETSPFLGNAEYPEINQKLSEYAGYYNVSPAAIVIAWILRHPANMQVLLGSTKVERLKDSLAGQEISLSREEWYDLYMAAGGIVP